jgi:hypothetical protein
MRKLLKIFFKLADNQTTAGNLKIPEEVKTKFPELVKMVLASESMDDEERNYWFSVLPIMTDSQIKELRDILETEKKKLAEIDAKYSKDGTSGSSGGPESNMSEEDLKKAEEKRLESKIKRKKEEQRHQEKAEQEAENLLSQLEDI